jgi:hypothetical protein
LWSCSRGLCPKTDSSSPSDVDLPELPSDFSILDKLKERIELAKKIESGMHKATKEAHEDNWLKQAAEAMDIELDSDLEYVLPLSLSWR